MGIFACSSERRSCDGWRGGCFNFGIGFRFGIQKTTATRVAVKYSDQKDLLKSSEGYRTLLVTREHKRGENKRGWAGGEKRR